ncbi:MAG: sulfotransferase [Candidatus Hodarchaeota archaeon]
MLKIKIKAKNHDSIKFPLLGYMGYSFSKFLDTFKGFSFLIDRMETWKLYKDIDKVDIDRPIYITGLARAGTTIILEMLNKHPDLASHKYHHLLLPYLPYYISWFLKKLKIYTKPFERIHMDGILVTQDSPEAVEEMFWQKFFDNTHNENISNIMNGYVSNPKFEMFYRNHIRKLLIIQNCPRYLAKNNYNITRLEYLLRFFPSSKFLLIIRSPVNHIASLIKQTNLFMKVEREEPLLKDWLRIIGHHEFGHHQVCINVGNAEVIRKIRKLWKNNATYVKGWAYYWRSVYDFIANTLDANKMLKKATLIVRYDELCDNPAKIIDQILEHTELPTTKFEKVKKYYIKHLHQPTYYTPDFSDQEMADIYEITNKTATRFGLSL